MNMLPRGPHFGFSTLRNKISGRLASAWARPVFICAILLVTIFSPAHAQQANRYDQVMRLVRALSDSPNVRMIPFGRSSNFCVPAIVISDFSTNPNNKTRILVCSGQHGNEFDAVRAVLSLSCKLASNTEPELLKKCVFIVAPMVNPSGVAAHTRLSADGIDLNRNWRNPNTLEAKHIDGLIKSWQPNILIDAHEQDKASHLEVPLCLSQTQQTALNQLANRLSTQAGIPAVHAGGNKSLFHSNYAFIGYAAYLIEVDSSLEFTTKYKQYASVILGAARSLSSNASLKPIISPSSSRFRLSDTGTYMTQKPPKPDESTPIFNVALLLTACYLICMAILKPFARENRKWSRRFLRCDIENFVEINPLLHRQQLVAITSRSWVNSKLRYCYTKEEPKPKPKSEYTVVTKLPKPAVERKRQVVT